MTDNGKKVFVGMSGGVDSSVSAALLKDEGFDVIGVFLKVWYPDFIECSWREERRDAMRVAAHLDIPFITIDLEEEYKKGVIDYMISEYKEGRTPNPDVMCNKEVKFGAFFSKALKMGADFIATGHYAQIKKSEDQQEYKMLAGADKEKDQSYFLWNLSQKELTCTLFPVGGFRKEKVRKLAKKFGLPTADKKDSQGLCFIGKLDALDFLKHFIDEEAGNVLDEKGEVIGKHDGSYFYTLGQRHGFTITKKGTHEKPYYVIAKDVNANTLTVSSEDISQKTEDGTNVKIKNTNWISGAAPAGEKIYTARVRYRQTLQNCHILECDGDEALVKFERSQVAPAGQSLVLYDGQECLGGGVIM